MKFIINIVILTFVFSCTKTQNEEKKEFISREYFSVSEFSKKIDSLKSSDVKADSLIPMMPKEEKRLNKNYFQGSIHFLILNEHNSYYVIKSLEPQISMCGVSSELSKQDSLAYISNSNQITDRIQPIKTSEITKILKKHRSAILNSYNNSPLTISFALKKDTLKGPTVYNIISFMEKDKMQLYTFRRMNEYELIKAK